jgi:hypothetical protein
MSTGPIALLPDRRESVKEGTSFPAAEKMPRPVIAIRLQLIENLTSELTGMFRIFRIKPEILYGRKDRSLF